MSIIRRTFKYPPLTPVSAHDEILVTYNDETDEVHVATRPNEWDAWTRPFPETGREDDDRSLAGKRVYGQDGRAYLLAEVDEPVTRVAETPTDAGFAVTVLDPDAGYPTQPPPNQ